MACASSDDGVPLNAGAPDVDLEGLAGLERGSVTYTVPGQGDERTIDIHLWYATDDTEGVTTEFGSILFFDVHTFDGGSIAPPRRGAPLLVYSHGGRGFEGQISTVARQFVRNGWVVVAPEHPGHHIFDYTDDTPYSFWAMRAYEVSQAIDYVENLPPEHALAGRVDTSRVMVSGHSFGGQNAWFTGGLPFDMESLRERCGDGCDDAELAAYEMYTPDPRIRASVSLDNLLDPNLIDDASFADMPTPVLHMSGTEGNDGTEIFSRASAAPLTWVSLVGGCHESFTGTRPCSTLELEDSLSATATYMLAFGARHVLDSDDPTVLGILDGSVEVSENAVLMRAPGAR